MSFLIHLKCHNSSFQNSKKASFFMNFDVQSSVDRKLTPVSLNPSVIFQPQRLRTFCRKNYEDYTLFFLYKNIFLCLTANFTLHISEIFLFLRIFRTLLVPKNILNFSLRICRSGLWTENHEEYFHKNRQKITFFR